MKFGVIRFPGSNCDDDAVYAIERVLGIEGATARVVWHKDHDLSDLDVVILPGGFNDGTNFRLHYVTAREMYNIIKAAEAGKSGDPSAYRDFQIRRITEPVRRRAAS